MDVYVKIASDYCKKMARLEDELAKEIFGCKYEELDEDERAEITFEAHDRMGE